MTSIRTVQIAALWTSLFTAQLAVCATLTLGVRLRSGLTSYASETGDEFQSVVISPLEINGDTIIPVGAVVSGRVRRARSIGIGLLRERALLDLDFYRYELPDGRSIPISARVLDVDNAREGVNSAGQIRGVLAASGPPGLIRGIWFTPSTTLLRRQAGGLAGITGVTGRLWGDAMGPAYAAGMLAVRWIALRFPEPEITLPAGADLSLAVTTVPPEAPRFKTIRPAEETSALADGLSALPVSLRRPSGKAVEDILNVAVPGTREDLIRAFGAAGWSQPETLTRKTFSLLYQAYVSMRPYPRAPVSKLLYENREPDIVFQRTLNTVARRHHIRMWKIAGEDLWVGAATHDWGITLGRKLQLVHTINPNVDLEREKVVSDLAAANCVERNTLVPRKASVKNGSGNGISTDGQMALIRLKDCDAGEPVPATVFSQPGSTVSRFVRRLALETRHYVIRDNVYSYGFRGMQMLYLRLTRPHQPAPEPSEKPADVQVSHRRQEG